MKADLIIDDTGWRSGSDGGLTWIKLDGVISGDIAGAHEYVHERRQNRPAIAVHDPLFATVTGNDRNP